MKPNKQFWKTIDISGLKDWERENMAFGLLDLRGCGCSIPPPNVNHPLWNQVIGDLFMRKDGSFLLHHLIMDKSCANSGGIRGNVIVDLSQEQALDWWLRNFPRAEGERVSEYVLNTVPNVLRHGVRNGINFDDYFHPME